MPPCPWKACVGRRRTRQRQAVLFRKVDRLQNDVLLQLPAVQHALVGAVDQQALQVDLRGRGAGGQCASSRLPAAQQVPAVTHHAARCHLPLRAPPQRGRLPRAHLRQAGAQVWQHIVRPGSHGFAGGNHKRHAALGGSRQRRPCARGQLLLAIEQRAVHVTDDQLHAALARGEGVGCGRESPLAGRAAPPMQPSLQGRRAAKAGSRVGARLTSPGPPAQAEKGHLS